MVGNVADPPGQACTWSRTLETDEEQGDSSCAAGTRTRNMGRTFRRGQTAAVLWLLFHSPCPGTRWMRLHRSAQRASQHPPPSISRAARQPATNSTLLLIKDVTCSRSMAGEAMRVSRHLKLSAQRMTLPLRSVRFGLCRRLRESGIIDTVS